MLPWGHLHMIKHVESSSEHLHTFASFRHSFNSQSIIGCPCHVVHVHVRWLELLGHCRMSGHVTAEELEIYVQAIQDDGPPNMMSRTKESDRKNGKNHFF